MRGQSMETKRLIEYACNMLEEDHPMTLRQLHYAIFSRNQVDYNNTMADYKRLSRATTVARRAHRAWELAGEGGLRPAFSIPSSWMVDETREGQMVSVWKDKDEYVETVKRAYRRDNWQDQVNYCEVWSEKATILGSVRPVADEYGITLRVCHGFGSTGMESDIGSRFEDLFHKRITVFYLGDHDPSGHVIEQDMHQRVQTASGVRFSMVRLAIHPEDIERFNLPPQTIKKSDSRAASFRKRFGQDASTVELDALPASVLRDRIEAAVSGLIDKESWNRQIEVQAMEMDCIRGFAERVQNLPQVNPKVAL